MSKKNQPIIVIKKIVQNADSAHGGSWKVAFADFMTAMMAFFLVMWLISQSEEVKKEVADYFSTPSVVEYNFKNYGVLLTLEKLFMDLINDPLKFFQSFIRPMDFTPDVMKMGTAKVIQDHLINELGEFTENIESNPDRISFDIPDYFLFEPGTSVNTEEFVNVMAKVQKITAGLENSLVRIHSQIHLYSLFQSESDKQNEEALTLKADQISQERMDIISKAIYKTLKNDTVELMGKFSTFKPSVEIPYDALSSKEAYGRWIKVEIERKNDLKSNESPQDEDFKDPRKIENEGQGIDILEPQVDFKEDKKLDVSPTEEIVKNNENEDEKASEKTEEDGFGGVQLNQQINQEGDLRVQTIEIKKEQKKDIRLQDNIIDEDEKEFRNPVSNPLDKVKIN